MIDNCSNNGIPAKIMHLNYFSTTMKLVSKKTLLDGTTIKIVASWLFMSPLFTLITKRMNVS